MKVLHLANGEVRNAYEFDDFNDEIKEKILGDQIDFEIEVMTEDSQYYYLAEEMERMQTPWFLAEAILEKHKDDLIETIKINEYYYDRHGKMHPVTCHVNKQNKIWKTEFDGVEVTKIV